MKNEATSGVELEYKVVGDKVIFSGILRKFDPKNSGGYVLSRNQIKSFNQAVFDFQSIIYNEKIFGSYWSPDLLIELENSFLIEDVHTKTDGDIFYILGDFVSTETFGGIHLLENCRKGTKIFPRITSEWEAVNSVMETKKIIKIDLMSPVIPKESKNE